MLISKNFLILLLVLLHLNCATNILGMVGAGSGAGIDVISKLKACPLKETNPPAGDAESILGHLFKGLGLWVDIGLGISLAISEPIKGLKVVGGVLYIFVTLISGYAQDHAENAGPKREENIQYTTDWKNCGDYFYTRGWIKIPYKVNQRREERVRLCKIQMNRKIDRAYLDLIQANFNKPKDEFLSHLKKTILKPEIILEGDPVEYLPESVGCYFDIIFYYQGGEDKFKADYIQYAQSKKKLPFNREIIPKALYEPCAHCSKSKSKVN